MKEVIVQLVTEAIEGSCMSTWYSCSSVTFAFQVSGILGNSSLAVFSHPRLPKHRQARISPNLRSWKYQNIARLEFPQNPQNPGIYEERGAIAAEISGILGKFEPGDVFASEAAHLP